MNIENIPTLNVNIEKVGPQGFSAYEIYLQGGGTLSEQEWLDSLKGETGLTPDVQAGETITLDSTELAKVTRTGTNENPIFTFAIPRGPVGESGVDGKEGPAGKEGPEGPAGKSAYQIWLEAGNEGTEQDFLNSLIGPEGSAGLSLEEVKNITGDLDDLSTEDKTNLVNAINEVLLSGGSSGSGSIELTENIALKGNDYGLYINKSANSIYVSINSTTTPTDASNGIVIFPNQLFLYSDYGGTGTLLKWTNNAIDLFYGNGYNQCYQFFLGQLVNTTSNQTVDGTKTFKKAPVCSVEATGDYQLVNKLYVDTAVNNTGGISLEDVTAITGDLTTLTTAKKDNLVNAINEIDKHADATIEGRSSDFDMSSLDYMVDKDSTSAYFTRTGLTISGFPGSAGQNTVVIPPKTIFYLKRGNGAFRQTGQIFYQLSPTDWVRSVGSGTGGNYAYKMADQDYVQQQIRNAVTNVLEGEY